MSVAERMKALRTRLHMTQTEFAEAAGMLQGHYAKIESGQNKASSVRVVEALARGASVSVANLKAYLDGTLDLSTLMSARAGGSVVVPAVSAPRSVEPAPETVGVLEAELFKAMDPEAFSAEDFDATRAAFREIAFLVHEGADLTSMARDWLVAARQLRREGRPVTTTNIAARVATGRGRIAEAKARDVDAVLNDEADEELERARKRSR